MTKALLRFFTAKEKVVLNALVSEICLASKIKNLGETATQSSPRLRAWVEHVSLFYVFAVLTNKTTVAHNW